jgi:transcriptional regulator with XRE-family HTH domain
MPKPRITPLHFIDNHTRHIGGHLQMLRKKRGLTQKELAEKIGVTREAVAAYESERGHILDVTLINIASVLKTSSDELLGIKIPKRDTPAVSRRLMKRMAIIDSFPEPTKKHIIKILDDCIKAYSK